MDSVELLAHPVRLRIVHALSGERVLTTAQLCERMPDVSKATMYRHVDLLAESGVLEVESEQRVRGAVERRFRLRRERAAIGADLSAEDYRRGFVIAMATLLAEFNAYVDGGDADPVADRVGFRQHAVWLNDKEIDKLIKDMRGAILPVLDNKPTGGRSQFLLSPILFPIEKPGR